MFQRIVATQNELLANTLIVEEPTKCIVFDL